MQNELYSTHSPHQSIAHLKIGGEYEYSYNKRLIQHQKTFHTPHIMMNKKLQGEGAIATSPP